MEGNKAGPHCIAFGVRGREELACLNNNKDGERKKTLRWEDTLEELILFLSWQLAGKMEGRVGGENIVQVGDLSLMWLWKILWWRSGNASADSPTAFCGFYPISDVGA